MKTQVQTKREKEKAVVSLMIELYCRRQHRQEGGALCSDCEALRDHARERTDKCVRMDEKTFCSSCRVHCYQPEMREKIRAVMRFSGPRMLLYHPITAIRHFLDNRM